MKRIILFLFLVTTSISLYSQNKPVKWYTIREAEVLSRQSFRPIFIDTYTDWCGWCKKMDQETFTNPVIADILNNKFYPVKFDAEGKESIDFFGQTYINDGKAGKAHQLAVALLRGQLSYPTVVFLTKQDNKLSASRCQGSDNQKRWKHCSAFLPIRLMKLNRGRIFRKILWGRYNKGNRRQA